MKSKAVLIWVLSVSFAAIAVFVYLILGDAPKTLPKIKLSYFANEQEVAESVSRRLYQEMSQNSFYWVGLEPGRNEQFGILLKLKNQIQERQKIQRVIVDSELALSAEQLQQLGATDQVLIKENIYDVGQQLQTLEKSQTPYLLITASIYSASVIKGNPIDKLKEKYDIRPITFSLAYFATDGEDEKNLLFPCRTDDNTGTASWGCLVTNKARSVRRRLKLDNEKTWLGLMDMSGERDYVLLLKSKNWPL